MQIVSSGSKIDEITRKSENILDGLNWNCIKTF